MADRGEEPEPEAAEPEQQQEGQPVHSHPRSPSPGANVHRADCPLEKEHPSPKTFVCIQSSDMTTPKDLVSKRAFGLQQTQPEKKSKESFLVSVVFPGLVTRQDCCIFTCELLKHILHQRQQLPLPYDQLAYFYRKQLENEVCQPSSRNKDLAQLKRCQRALADLDEILCNLETLFTLTAVPHVLFLLGGSPVCPKEMYEINMEGVLAGNAQQSLKTQSCLRKLFHSLFVADAFSDFKSSPIMGAVLMVQGHRNCGTDWFRPKLNFKVPNRGRKLLVNLSCSEEHSHLARSPQQTTRASDDDYVWFQAPVTFKGFQD